MSADAASCRLFLHSLIIAEKREDHLLGMDKEKDAKRKYQEVIS